MSWFWWVACFWILRLPTAHIFQSCELETSAFTLEGLRYCSDSQEDGLPGKHLISQDLRQKTCLSYWIVMQKITGVRWEMCNSPAILSHFLTSSHFLLRYKMMKQLSSNFWNTSKPSSTKLRMFWIIKWRVRVFKLGWRSKTTLPHYDEKVLDLYIACTALLGTS